MKNKIQKKLIIILLNLFITNLVLAQNIEFKATDIEFFQNKNLIDENNGIVIIKEDRISAEGNEIKYFKEDLYCWLQKVKLSKPTKI